jgi:SAM-dependent methyltransferase
MKPGHSTVEAPGGADSRRSREPFFASCPVCATKEHAPVVSFPELVFVRCRGCDVIYKSEQVPGLGAGYETEYFQAGNSKYFRRWEHRVAKCRRQVEACLALAPRAKNLLDVGCSAGYMIAAASSLNLDAVGLDYSAYVVEMCNKRGLKAVHGSLTNLPFGDQSFDIVSLKAVLEHVPDPMAGLREAARVLAPGGVIFVVVPDGDYFKNTWVPRTGRNFRPDARGWQHHIYFRSPSFALACARTGLRVAHEGRGALHLSSTPAWKRPLERVRWAAQSLWTSFTRATRLRRDIHAFVVKDAL